jgi:hypothetical protein
MQNSDHLQDGVEDCWVLLQIQRKYTSILQNVLSDPGLCLEMDLSNTNVGYSSNTVILSGA